MNQKSDIFCQIICLGIQGVTSHGH
jgi:hypothetical protein